MLIESVWLYINLQYNIMIKYIDIVYNHMLHQIYEVIFEESHSRNKSIIWYRNSPAPTIHGTQLFGGQLPMKYQTRRSVDKEYIDLRKGKHSTDVYELLAITVEVSVDT